MAPAVFALLRFHAVHTTTPVPVAPYVMFIHRERNAVVTDRSLKLGNPSG